MDLDHTRPYRHTDKTRGDAAGSTDPAARAGDGHTESAARTRQTGMDNLGPLGRFHHRVRTHGNWAVEQPFPGIYLWRAPHGSIYLVDHTGTRKVTAPWTKSTDNGDSQAHDRLATVTPLETTSP